MIDTYAQFLDTKRWSWHGYLDSDALRLWCYGCNQLCFAHGIACFKQENT